LNVTAGKLPGDVHRLGVRLGVLCESAQSANAAGVVGNFKQRPAFSRCGRPLPLVNFHHDIANRHGFRF